MNHCLFATASVYYHILLPLSTKFFKKLQAMRKSAVFPSDGKLAYQMMKMLPISYGASKSSASAELAKKLRFFREFPRTVFELRMAQLRMAYLSDRGACSPGRVFLFSYGASKSSASAELAKKLRFFRESPRTVFELRMAHMAQLRIPTHPDR